jgi:lysozyme
MTAIETAAALIRQFEGYRSRAYRCPAGKWTIGYGHTAGVKAGDVWTQEQADRALEQDIGKYRKAVLIACPDLIDHPNRLAACISLAYNIGTGAFAGSSVARHINKGDSRAAADAFLLWVNAGGKKLEGLVRRRQAEQAVFLKD